MHSNISGLDAEPENPGMFTSYSFLPKAEGLRFLSVSQDRSTVVHTEITAFFFLIVFLFFQSFNVLIRYCLIDISIFLALIIILCGHHNSGTFIPQWGRWAWAIRIIFVTQLQQLIKFRIYAVTTTKVVITIIQ